MKKMNKEIRNIQSVCRSDKIIRHVKSHIKQINRDGAFKFASELIISHPNFDIKVNNIQTTWSTLVKKNPKIINNSNGSSKTFLFDNAFSSKMYAEIIEIISVMGKTSNIALVDKDDEQPWYKEQLIGKDIYELNEDNTYQQMRECMCNEGSSSSFVFKFKNNDVRFADIEDKPELQIINLDIEGTSSTFDTPLLYRYVCTECKHVSERKEYEVSSSHSSSKCPNLIEKETEKGSVKIKTCNAILHPDKTQTETKTLYYCSGTHKKEDGTNIRVSVISESNQTSGSYVAAVFKVPNVNNTPVVFVVDIKQKEKISMPLPKRKKNEHYVMTLVNGIDDYIEKTTNYKHYGFLPVKLAFLLQSAVRYIPGFKYDFNIAIIGDRGSGKSTISKYWSYLLYSDKTLNINSGSLRTTKLRGTMEYVSLFNERQQVLSKGFLGEKDNIVIDELADNEILKNDLKQFLREDKYSFAMQGATSEYTKRTAQVTTTENINIAHMNKYRNLVRNFYKTDECNYETSESKPMWRESWDVQLPLEKIDNLYLRIAVNEVRSEFMRKDINWIDGSSTSLSDRFPFYFLLSTENESSKLYDIIIKNAINNSVNNRDEELRRVLNANDLTEYFENMKTVSNVTNEEEYAKKLYAMLQKYSNLRTRSFTDCFVILKLCRMIDGRDCYNNKDMEIVQYIIENTNSKVFISETDTFKVSGPKDTLIPEMVVNESLFTTSSTLGL